MIGGESVKLVIMYVLGRGSTDHIESLPGGEECVSQLSVSGSAEGEDEKEGNVEEIEPQ